MVSPSCSARPSSSFVQYIVFLSSERKAIDTNILGVIPFSRSSTQAALLTCGARGENRAHEFLHLLLHSRPLGCSCGFARRCFLCPFVHPEVPVAPEQSRIPSLSVLSMVQSFNIRVRVYFMLGLM